MKIETEYAFEVIRRAIINDIDEPLDFQLMEAVLKNNLFQF